MPKYAVWQSRRIFVTSTFRDMHAERSYLNDHVFPILREKLRERFHHLEPVDLRWGVETDQLNELEAKEILVLKVCLGEIKLSRPFLIGLIGDRYGWQPPEERMRAAADEAGFAGDVAGKSVTALEIEYGVLDSDDQRKLSRFYFRDPLPYATMGAATADYSDLHSGQADAADAQNRLEALKARIRRQLPGRWRNYHAGWDAEHCRVTGLEAWGAAVLEDVWADLDAATKEYEHAAPATWHQEEAWVLEQFVEEKSHDFCGRLTTLDDLKQMALGEDETWGVCVTGESGSGKSSLFAKLSRTLAGHAVLLLRHAAGISSRSSQVDTLLRAWIGEIAQSLGMTDPAPGLTGFDNLRKSFAELLSRAATGRRVVCLIDALNQFERTPVARHIQWLPELWPANARLIATAMPGEESDVLSRRTGCRLLPLPVLSEEEAGEIIATVCARYRKTLHSEVKSLLLAKRLQDGRAACGVPLWLELAVEVLLLLDADDFARAEREFDGQPEHRLHLLLLHTAGHIPASVEDLYGYLLRRVGRLHGEGFSRTFSELVAVSRTGWRESDLRVLIPEITGEAWAPLRFAALRRTFGSQLVQRGASGQWDFSHAQMRAAVERWSLADRTARRERHRQTATYLAALPVGDQLRQTELMVHLIRADLRREAAELYSGSLAAEEEAGATAALAAYIIEGIALGSDSELNWVLGLRRVNLTNARLRGIAARWLSALNPALANDAPLAVCRSLGEAAVACFEDLQRRDRQSADCAFDLGVAYGKLGDLHVSAGELNHSLKFLQKALNISEALRRRFPNSADYARDLAILYSKLGELHRSQSDMDRAMEFQQKAIKIKEQLHQWNPESTEYGRDLGLSYLRMGGMYYDVGELDRALEFYQKDVRLAEDLGTRAPNSVDCARDLGVSYGKMGDLHRSLGLADRALVLYAGQCDVIAALHRRIPDSIDIARELGVAYGKLGELNRLVGAPERALEYQQKALDLSERLRRLVPDSAALANDLAVSCMRMGDLNRSLGDQARAVEFYQKAVGPSEELRRRAPNVAEYASNLLWVYDRLGGAALELGRLGVAGADYRRVLELLDDLERHFPGFRLEPSMSNSAVRAHFREQLGRAENPSRTPQRRSMA